MNRHMTSSVLTTVATVCMLIAIPLGGAQTKSTSGQAGQFRLRGQKLDSATARGMHADVFSLHGSAAPLALDHYLTTSDGDFVMSGVAHLSANVPSDVNPMRLSPSPPNASTDDKLLSPDLNGDGVTDALDAIEILSVWGTNATEEEAADLDHDGFVDSNDLLEFLSR